MKIKSIYPILTLVFFLGPIFLKAQEWSSTITTPGSADLIYRTGNVGIGTITPNQSFKLHVVGRSDFEGIMSFKNNTTGYISWSTTDLRLVSKQDYLNLGAANFTNQLVIEGATGNIGIGVTNPNTILHIKSSDGYQEIQFLSGTSTSGYRLDIGINDDGVNFTNNSTSRGFNFSNANGNLVTISNTGNVGVGTAPNPGLPLVVAGTIESASVTTTGAPSFFSLASSDGSALELKYTEELRGNIPKDVWQYRIGGSTRNIAFTYYDAATVLFMDMSNQRIGIGTVTPEAKLEIKGNSAVYSDFAGYSGATAGTLPNGKAPSLIISEEPSGTLVSGVGGQNTYRGGLSFGQGGPGVYSVNPNPAGSPYYGDIRFHTTYWNGTGYSNGDRMIIHHNGNVGIGTTEAPTKKLVVEDGDIRILRRSGDAQLQLTDYNLRNWYMRVVDNVDRFSIADDVTEFLSIKGGNGNVGIGISNPANAKLEIVQTANSEGLRVDGASGAFAFVVEAGTSNIAHVRSGLTIGQNYFSTPPSNGLIVEGNMGIGTTDPGLYKLAVEGQVGARSVKVTQALWADYVFASSYELMPLEQVEAYIQKNQHLPNVASAQEIEQDGFILEEMDAKLMEKIEELTLYVIELQKQDKEQKDRIKRLEMQNSRVERLEKVNK